MIGPNFIVLSFCGFVRFWVCSVRVSSEPQPFFYTHHRDSPPSSCASSQKRCACVYNQSRERKTEREAEKTRSICIMFLMWVTIIQFLHSFFSSVGFGCGSSHKDKLIVHINIFVVVVVVCISFNHQALGIWL
jgi:hypothetical protein